MMTHIIYDWEPKVGNNFSIYTFLVLPILHITRVLHVRYRDLDAVRARSSVGNYGGSLRPENDSVCSIFPSSALQISLEILYEGLTHINTISRPVSLLNISMFSSPGSPAMKIT